MLQINQFRKAYQRQLVLQIEHFTIAPEIYWVQGSNGSGKSTLLKAIAGMTSFEGDIVLNKALTLKRQPTAYRSAVNFAEAEPMFPPFLTGTDLIRLFKTAKNAPAHQEDHYLETMHMTAYVDEPVGTYSSGMLKKLSLVLAFLGRPSCVLLDEPLTTLDAGSLPILYAWIASLSQQQEMIFLLSSHQPFQGGLLPTVQPIVVDRATIGYSA